MAWLWIRTITFIFISTKGYKFLNFLEANKNITILGHLMNETSKGSTLQKML